MRIFFMLFFMAAISVAQGQEQITGIVLNNKTQAPIIGATIFAPDFNEGTITDLNGRFSIGLGLTKSKNLNLVISSLGYATQTITINPFKDNEVEIYLEPSAIEMEEVIISTPFHQLQSDNVMKVERINSNELSKKGAINLTEGISQIAGVSTLSTGTGIGKPVIRGLSSNRVLVFAQGTRMENQQFGGEHGLGLSSSGVESVEVIKGPASLLYGSDAIGGVLYLNPENYAPRNSTEIDVKTAFHSNTLGLESNIGIKTSLEKFKFLLRGNYASHSDFKTGTGQRVTNSRFRELDLKSGVGYQSGIYKADLRYNYNSSKLGIPEEIGHQTTSRSLTVPYQDVKNHILSLENNLYFNNSSLDFSIGYLFNNRKEFEGHHHEETHEHEAPHETHETAHEMTHAALEMHLETLNYDLKYHVPEMGAFETILGVQGMIQNNANFGEEILIPNAKTNDFGIFATTHFHLKTIDIQGGLRYDTRHITSEASGTTGQPGYLPAINRKFNSYNGALGIKYDFLSQFNLRLNLATGFRAPNLAELTSNGIHHGSNRYEIGNPELENEQSYQIDLALEYGNKHIEVFANAFYNNISNYIFLEPTGETISERPVFEYVQQNARLFGGEAGIHLHPHPWDWLHLKSTYEMVIGKKENGTYLPLIPAHSIFNMLQVELNKQKFPINYGFIGLESVFQQNKTSRFETATDSYSLLSAGFGNDFVIGKSQLQVRISGNNLLNKTYFSHLSRLKTIGIPNIGRNISVSLKMVF